MAVNSFDTEIAKLVGVNAAVIYQNINYWCEKNIANEKHIHDGKVWTYNSIKAFCTLFPYFSAKQIRTAIDKLIDENLIEVGNFNKSAYDRTLWYSSIFQNQKIDLPKKANENAQNGEPIPDSKPDDKQQIKKDNKKSATESVKELYNQILANTENRYSLPKVKVLTDKRKKIISTLLTLVDKDLTKVEAYFNWLLNNADNHKWIFGDNQRGWTAGIEYVCRDETFAKATENRLVDWSAKDDK